MSSPTPSDALSPEPQISESSSPTNLSLPQSKGTSAFSFAVNPKHLLNDLLIALMSYGGMLIAAIITAVLLALIGGLALADELPEQVNYFSFFEDVDINPLVFVGLVFQLVAVGVGGAFALKAKELDTDSDSLFSSSSVEQINLHLHFWPLLVTLAGVAGVYFLSEWAEKKAVGSHTPRSVLTVWLHSLVTGLMLALVTVVLTLITTPRFSTEESYLPAKITLSALSWGTFFWPLLLGTLVSAMARLKVSAIPTRFTDRFHRVAPGMTTALRIVTIVLVALTLVTGLVLFIALIVKADFKTALSLMLLAPSLSVLGTGLAMLSAGGLHQSGYASNHDYFYAWTGAVGAWSILLILLVLVAVIGVGFAWAGRRPRINNLSTWFVLPVAFFIAGLALTLLSNLSFSFSNGEDAYKLRLGLAWWTPIVTLLWGFISEVISRFVAPAVAPSLPASARRFLIGTPTQLRFTNDGANATPSAPASPETGEPHHENPVASAPAAASVVAGENSVYDHSQPGNMGEPREPMSPKTKKNIKIGFFSLLGLLGLIGLAFAAVAILNATMFNPKNVVSSYMDSVKNGDVENAVSTIDPNVSSEERALLTSEVLAGADKKVSDYEIKDVEKADDGEHAVAQVRVTQDQKSSDVSLNLVRSGGILGVNQWEIAPEQSGLYKTVDVAVPNGVDGLTVNGVTVKVEGGAKATASPSSSSYSDSSSANSQTHHFVVLPGEYTFKAPEGTKYITFGDDQKALASVGNDSSSTVQFQQSLTSEVLADAKVAANAKLDECTQVKEFSVDECGFDSYHSGDDYRNPSWTIESYPEYALSNSSYSSYSSSDMDSVNPNQPLYLNVSKSGEAKLTYEYKNYDDEWEERDDTENISGYFVVEISGDTLNLVNNSDSTGF